MAADNVCPACEFRFTPLVRVHACTETWEEDDGSFGFTVTRCEVDERGAMSVSVSGGNAEAMEDLLRGDADPSEIPERER